MPKIGRFDEVASIETVRRNLPAARQQFGSILSGKTAIGEDLVLLLAGNNRSHLRGPIERIADPDLASPLDQRGQKLVVDILVEKEPGSGGTALTGIGEDREERPVDRFIEISIGENDVRAICHRVRA